MHVRSVPIPKPCPARWDRMEGGDRVRFCRECRKTVHDLSAMTASEATEFVAAHPSACLRYTYDRRTGVILHGGAGCDRARVRIAVRRTGALAALGLALAGPAFAAPQVDEAEASWLREKAVAVGVWLGILEEVPAPPIEPVTLAGAPVPIERVVVQGEPPAEPPRPVEPPKVDPAKPHIPELDGR